MCFSNIYIYTVYSSPTISFDISLFLHTNHKILALCNHLLYGRKPKKSRKKLTNKKKKYICLQCILRIIKKFVLSTYFFTGAKNKPDRRFSSGETRPDFKWGQKIDKWILFFWLSNVFCACSSHFCCPSTKRTIRKGVREEEGPPSYTQSGFRKKHFKDAPLAGPRRGFGPCQRRSGATLKGGAPDHSASLLPSFLLRGIRSIVGSIFLLLPSNVPSFFCSTSTK
eukprot:GEMP01098085.1.p1 GENE.GEMP01098085.1~~GEMP01098085.1.p1  ORF type:complete len:225 (-),score=-7.13 GEMP01098085.1:22-696(-)